MNLSQLREELADTVGDAIPDLTTYTHIPGRVMLPAVWVMAGSPYIAAAETWGQFDVRLVAVLAVLPGDNKAETDELDSHIQAAHQALIDAGYVVEEVSQPVSHEINGGELLAVAINVVATTT